MMDKHDEINQILTRIAEQLEEILEEPSLQDLTSEEMIVLAAELVVGLPITTMKMGQPVGVVDRDRAWFMVDDEDAVPIFKKDQYED